jgi:hypothetical protein
MKDIEDIAATKTMAGACICEDELNIKEKAFCAVLKKNGRPGDYIVVSSGLTLADLLCGDGVLRMAPWFREDGEIKVFEAQGFDVAGWWAEAASGFLMHAPFDGYGGLIAFDVACVIAEQPNPSHALVEWVESIIQEIPEIAMEDAIQCIPNDICQYVGIRFAIGSRRLILGEAGSEDHPLFYLHEETVCESK